MDMKLDGLGYWKLFVLSFVVFVVRVFDHKPRPRQDIKGRSIH
jgi:hypothetical protein